MRPDKVRKIRKIIRRRDEIHPLLVAVSSLIISLGMGLALIDSTVPHLKFSIRIAYISAILIIVICLFVAAIYIKRVNLSQFQSFIKTKKVIHSIWFLIIFFLSISSVEYIIYLRHREAFNISSDIVEVRSKARQEKVIRQIETLAHYEEAYTALCNEINPHTNYYVRYDNKDYYTIIGSDTIMIHPNHYPGTGSNLSVQDNKVRSYQNTRSFGISIKGENRSAGHPESREIRNELQKNDSISGKSIQNLCGDIIIHYRDLRNNYESTLHEIQRLSFGQFIGYYLGNNDFTGRHCHILVRIIVLFEAFVITFILGYISQLIYKILDGE